MLFREIIAVYSEYHTKPMNTLCGPNAEILNVVVITSSTSVALKNVHKRLEYL
jgi:hypothetical protein